MGIYTILYCIISLVILLFSFINPRISWLIVAITVIFQFITLWAIKKSFHTQEVPELSQEANIFLNKHAHFYLYPFASQQQSFGSSIIRTISVISAIIGCFYKFWWGILFGLIIYLIMPILEVGFKPTLHFFNEIDRDAHNEISIYISKNQFPNTEHK